MYIAILSVILISVVQLRMIKNNGSKGVKAVYITLMLISIIYIYGIASFMDMWVPEKLIGHIFKPISKWVFQYKY